MRKKCKYHTINSVNIPPRPGIILPVSFIFDFLLKYEITISPIWLTVEIKKQLLKSYIKSYYFQNQVWKLNKILTKNNDNKYPLSCLNKSY